MGLACIRITAVIAFEVRNSGSRRLAIRSPVLPAGKLLTNPTRAGAILASQIVNSVLNHGP